LQRASPAQSFRAEHFAFEPAHGPDAATLAPWNAATSAFQYVTPSQPHRGESAGSVSLADFFAQPPEAPHALVLQYSPAAQPSSEEQGVGLGPPLVLVPELPLAPLDADPLDADPLDVEPDEDPSPPDAEPLDAPPEDVVAPEELPKSSVSAAPPQEARHASDANAIEPSKISSFMRSFQGNADSSS
jgi:hypothetical protein